MDNFWGRTLGSALLIAGSCIGAGMLALPVVTGLAGFAPACAFFFLAWAYMLLTGLLVMEINLWFPKGTSLISMAKGILGPWGGVLTWLTFLFLFLSLGVAYINASGSVLSDLLGATLGLSLKPSEGMFIFSGLCVFLVFMGTGPVDWVNRTLMVFLVSSFLFLLALGLDAINMENFSYSEWKEIPASLPVLVLSFGYHNMIPSLANYLNKNGKQIFRAILLGSFLPLLFYLSWEALILGLVPAGDGETFKEALSKGGIVTQVLAGVSGGQQVFLGTLLFSLFAVATSLFAQTLSLVDFLADGLSWALTLPKRLFLALLAIIPSLIFALLYPNVFAQALRVAGAFGAVILFGVLPALMIWKGQRSLGHCLQKPILGRAPVLLGILLASITIVAIEITVLLESAA